MVLRRKPIQRLGPYKTTGFQELQDKSCKLHVRVLNENLDRFFKNKEKKREKRKKKRCVAQQVELHTSNKYNNFVALKR